MQNESTSPEAAESVEPVDTYEEAFAKKLAKSRVENLNVGKLETEEEKKSKKILIISLIAVFALLIGGAAGYYFAIYKPEQDRLAKEAAEAQAAAEAAKAKEQVPLEEAVKEPETPKYYSVLSGEEIANETDSSSPTFCVQIPNGSDGARPQVGLQDAKIVFEAIAESGITRFAAIFQNPPAVVGPIRSLRLYYLNWDVPFDCTIVHAGGSVEALEAVRAYGVRDLSENYDYMWRSSANYTVQRLWNNLFTSGEYLNNFNRNNGYLSSDIKSFPRFTPSAAARNKVDVQITERLKIDQPSSGNTDTLTPKVTHIELRFGAIPNFNPVYDYDATNNTYKRSYATGAPHTSYDCSDKSGEITPELVCSEEQLAPSVIIAMIVQEKKASYDNYHEDISTIGAGDAYVFQNGGMIEATWEKSSKDAQIIFRNRAGEEIKLVPGQTWISAIPAAYSGAGVEYK
ncbi:DUF3048 domain-containing protein [Candidatus Saccharibacteria bacterium]|nr:DUF3048 domain-containing protein [Candidatus Saccharibacteria bacterium]